MAPFSVAQLRTKAEEGLPQLRSKAGEGFQYAKGHTARLKSSSSSQVPPDKRSPPPPPPSRKPTSPPVPAPPPPPRAAGSQPSPPEYSGRPPLPLRSLSSPLATDPAPPRFSFSAISKEDKHAFFALLDEVCTLRCCSYGATSSLMTGSPVFRSQDWFRRDKRQSATCRKASRRASSCTSLQPHTHTHTCSNLSVFPL
jgi:hypothetical protein